MKKKIIPVVIVIIALLIGCVGYICYRNNEVKKYSASLLLLLRKSDRMMLPIRNYLGSQVILPLLQYQMERLVVRSRVHVR